MLEMFVDGSNGDAWSLRPAGDKDAKPLHFETLFHAIQAKRVLESWKKEDNRGKEK